MKITIGGLTAEVGEFSDVIEKVVEHYKQGRMVIVRAPNGGILVGVEDMERIVQTNKGEEAAVIECVDPVEWEKTDCPEVCAAARMAYYLPRRALMSGVLTSEQQTTMQEFAALCKRLEPAARTNVGKRALIERAIARSIAWLKKEPKALLLLVCPITRNVDQLDWTSVGPHRPEFRNVVTNRIRRGFLPLGLLCPPGVMNLMAGSVPPELRKDFVEFAKLESDVIIKTMAGQLSKDVSWIEEKKTGTITFEGGSGKSDLWFLQDWDADGEPRQ